MSLPQETAPATVSSPKRRYIVAGLGAGLIAGVASLLNWNRTPVSSTGQIPGGGTSGVKAADTDSTASFQAQETGPVGQPMTREWFLPHVQTSFQMSSGLLDSLTLKLLDVSPAMSLTNGAIHYTSYTLMFETLQPRTMEGKIYQFTHEALGTLDLFVEPVGRPLPQQRYEAVITRRTA